MKLKMREFFQGRDVWALLLPQQAVVTVLEPGSVYEVDEALGDFLLQNRKAEPVIPAVREHRELDVEPQFEQAIEPPRPLSAPRKRGKRQ